LEGSLMKPWIGLVAIILCAVQFGWSDDQTTQRVSQLVEAGKTEEAKAILLPLLRWEPENAEAHELMGDVFRKQGDVKAAEREYRRAIELGRRDAGILNSLATVQKWNRHFSEARASYARELEIAPYQLGTRDELQDLEYKRGLSLFGAYGGWETDSTTKGWQGELSYGGLDRIDPYVGA